MKYLFFDEMIIKNEIFWIENMNAICFCVFDDLKCITKVKKHIKLSNIGVDYCYANKLYPHYTEDHPSARNKFIQDILMMHSFKIYISVWSNHIDNLYEDKNTLDLLKNAILKFKRLWIHQTYLKFEEWKLQKYSKIMEMCKKFSIKANAEITKKNDLYSCFPDYILWIIKDFIKDCLNEEWPYSKRKSNIPWSEQNLNIISSKISLCRINLPPLICWNFCFSKWNYDKWKQQIKQTIEKE